MEHILLPEKYAGYLERFTKAEYSGSFKSYCMLAEPFFTKLELCPESTEAAAAELVDYAETTLPRFFGRKLALHDIRTFLFVYTIPAALNRESRVCHSFADSLIEKWNSRHSDIVLNKATFSELFGGFRTRIMGFDVRE